MKRFKNALLAVAAALLIAQSLLFTSPGHALAQSISSVTSVLVINTAANPIPVRDVEGAHQPFQRTEVLGIGDGQNFAAAAHTTVPAGKRLVIESVAVLMYLPQGQTPVYARLKTSDPSAGSLSGFPAFALTRQGVQSDSKVFYAGTYSFRMYAGPGTIVSMDAARSASAGITLTQFTVSGYYIDLPSS
jgi:hypothetical protein